MDTKESVKWDMGTEQAISSMYWDKARRIGNDMVRAVICKMAEESLGHYQKLRNWHVKQGFGISVPETNMSDVELSELLQAGMEEERTMQRKYREQLAECKDAQLAELLKRLISDEERHERMLNEAYGELVK
jgi:rubrerythrin